jgi:hypothetical protein
MVQASRLSCQDSSAARRGKQKTMILRNGRSFSAYEHEGRLRWK